MDYSLEDIYLTLCGELMDDACVPGVENAFFPGSPCSREYENLRRAYDRLLARLGKSSEDEDVEEIIGCMLAMQRELCFRMFRLGQNFPVSLQGSASRRAFFRRCLAKFRFFW